MADQKLTELIEDTTPTSDDLVYTVTDPAGTPASRKVTLRNAQLAGEVVQVVSTLTTSVATGTTTIPLDDTIPQNTEGDQYMTRSITPLATTNILVIEAVVNLASSAGTGNLVAALFQDTTASALAIGWEAAGSNGTPHQIIVRHTMTAGTTSATTFKIRAGNAATAGTTTFNGSGGTRYLGGVTHSSIVIWEYKV